MAASPSGKKTSRTGKAHPQTKNKPGIQKKSSAAGSKSGGGSAAKSSGRTGHHSPSRSTTKRSRTGTKSASPSKSAAKSKARKKTVTGSSRVLSWLRGLTLGLVLGCAAVLLAIYWPHIQQILAHKPGDGTAVRPAAAIQTPPVAKTRRTQPVRQAKGPKPAARPESKSSQGMIYEEENDVDPQVKKLDQMLYIALQKIGVSEKEMDFLKVTRRHQGETAWDHVLIQAGLPTEISADQAVAGLKKTLSGPGDGSYRGVSPRLTSKTDPKGLLIDVYLEKMHTHTIRLLSPVQTARLTPRPEPTPVSKPRQTVGPEKPKVAIVIDDFGINRQMADCFMDLEMPITVSILPFLPHSKDIARRAHQKGLEVMLHLPMQPQKYPNINPGPGVLLTSMDRNEIKRRVKKAIEAVPYVIAVNNHMGSRFTEDRERIGWALEEIHQHGLAFLDSMTSNRSQAFKEARRRNLTTSYRSIFLDNIQDEQAIMVQLKKLVAKARQQGVAVGIGHVYPVTCQVLRNEYNQLSSKVDLVPFTRIFQN